MGDDPPEIQRSVLKFVFRRLLANPKKKKGRH